MILLTILLREKTLGKNVLNNNVVFLIKMRRNIVLNSLFIVLFIIFLILSFIIDFFFFIPIICFLPFSFRSTRQNKFKSKISVNEKHSYQNHKNLEVRHCPRCGGEISKSIARFCYHCGEKLNII